MPDHDVRVIGDPNPDWTAGLHSVLTFSGKLRLHALLEFQHGHQMWNGTRGALYPFGTHKDTEIRGLRTTWGSFKGVQTVGPGTDTTVEISQSWFQGNGSGTGPVAAQVVEDASFAKLREVAVDYALPSAVAERLGLSGVNLRIAGRNLKTWTDYTGLDPETNLTGTLGGIRSYDYFNHPQSRQWIVTVGLTH